MEPEVGKSPFPVAKSPVQPRTVGTLDFFDALKEVTAGRRITRLDWGDNNSYGYLKDSLLLIHLRGKDHQWMISEGDLIGEDWVII